MTGDLEQPPITHAGARPGDALILTRPLGSGTLLAADMALMARGDDLAALFKVLSQSNGTAAKALSSAHAMTDVTGFGLAGHLMTILTASKVSAVIDLDQIPLFQGVADLLGKGVRSTLWEANREIIDMDLPDDPRAGVLFDPQTAGGLLAAVASEEAATRIAELTESGHAAAIIGEIEEGPPGITLR